MLKAWATGAAGSERSNRHWAKGCYSSITTYSGFWRVAAVSFCAIDCVSLVYAFRLDTASLNIDNLSFVTFSEVIAIDSFNPQF